MGFSRITIDRHQCGGIPCLRGMRIPVATVVEMVAQGVSAAEIVVTFPDLAAEDIEEALRYAATTVRDGERPFSGI